MKKPVAVVAALALLGPTPRALAQGPLYQQHWFYASHNLQVDRNVDVLIELIRRAAKRGYNGVVLADYKFNVLDRVPARYFKNVARVRQAAADAGGRCCR
jgi:hypothetical protein